MKKNKLIISFLLIIFSIAFLSSCTENISYDEDAIKLTVQEIISTPTYTWFKQQMDAYQPDTNVVNEIKNYFDPNRHKLYLYANFTCGCTSQQEDLSHFCKVFQVCNIQDSFFEIYSMRKSTDRHPHKNLFSMAQLPECVVMKDTNAVYFTLDTMRYNKLYGRTISVEQLLLNGLMK